MKTCKNKSYFFIEDPPRVLLEIMEKHRNSTEFLINPMGRREQNSPAEDINPQLCKVPDYFKCDNTGLLNMQENPNQVVDAYSSFQRVELSSLIGSVLTFVVVVVVVLSFNMKITYFIFKTLILHFNKYSSPD